MKVRPIGEQRIQMSVPAFRAAQLLARMEGVTVEQAIERLLCGFLEGRLEAIAEYQREREEAVPSRRPPARVIVLDERRRRRGPDGQSRNAVGRSARQRERSREIRRRAAQLRQHSAEAKRLAAAAREKADACAAWCARAVPPGA
jgi:hypothetical protein